MMASNPLAKACRKHGMQRLPASACSLTGGLNSEFGLGFRFSWVWGLVVLSPLACRVHIGLSLRRWALPGSCGASRSQLWAWHAPSRADCTCLHVCKLSELTALPGRSKSYQWFIQTGWVGRLLQPCEAQCCCILCHN